MPTSKPSSSSRTSTPKAAPKRIARKPSSSSRPLRKAAPAARKTQPSTAKPKASASIGTKQSRLIALLRGSTGATVDQMTDLTGWQAHTVRGTISGVLRKKLGLTVSCTSGEAGSRIYRIVKAA